MRSDLPKKQARATPKRTAKKPKSRKKPARKAAAPKSGQKKPESAKPPIPVPFPNLPPQFNPYAVETGVDVVKKAALRFRVLFPNKYNAVKAAMTPVDVMLLAMQIELHKGQYAKAANHARNAAPYIHPRLAHVHSTGAVTKLDDISDEGLSALLGVIEEKLRDRGAIDGRTVEGPRGGEGQTGPAPARAVVVHTVSR